MKRPVYCLTTSKRRRINPKRVCVDTIGSDTDAHGLNPDRLCRPRVAVAFCMSDVSMAAHGDHTQVCAPPTGRYDHVVSIAAASAGAHGATHCSEVDFLQRYEQIKSTRGLSVSAIARQPRR